ncbi:hypothetical protein Dimus_026480, partial [Dionaea muscipula]
PMQHRHCVEAVERTLRDFCDNSLPFGGITVVLGGDFRQILPVVPKGSREQIVQASLRSSVIWRNLKILTLDVNMRMQTTDNNGSKYADFLRETLQIVEFTGVRSSCPYTWQEHPRVDISRCSGGPAHTKGCRMQDKLGGVVIASATCDPKNPS